MFPESGKYDLKLQNLRDAWLVQLVEPVSLDLEVVSLSPMLGVETTLKKKKKTGKNLRLSTNFFQVHFYHSCSGI